MANPQIADGYTKIANEIMDALIAAHLSGQEMRVTLFVIRKTYGFNKTEDFISLSQMMAAVGMSKIRASQVVRSLELMKILTVKENINGLTKKYSFNKDFDTWDTVKEKLNRKEKTKQTVKVLRNRPLRKTLTTKETITKETITKDIYRSNDFDRLWITYPKKVGKQAAIRAYRSHIKQIPPIEQLLAIVDRQKQTDQWKRGYIPNPATWINQGRWDDDITSMDGGQNGSTGTHKIYNRQGQGISTRQSEIDAEIERITREYYASKDKETAAADEA